MNKCHVAVRCGMVMGKLQREEGLRVQWKVPGEAGWCECYNSASPIYVIVCWDQGEAVQ